MPDPHRKRYKTDSFCSKLKFVFFQTSVNLNCEPKIPTQHKVLLRHFSVGEEKLQKRQPIRSNDESELWMNIHSPVIINMDSWAADCHIQLSIWNSLSCSDSDSQYFEIVTEVRYS